MRASLQFMIPALVMSLHPLPSSAADVLAGKTVADAKCAQCHQPNDWEGEGAPLLEGLISDIVAGKVKHKSKLELSPQEIVNIAAYWGSAGVVDQGGKKRPKRK